MVPVYRMTPRPPTLLNPGSVGLQSSENVCFNC